MLTGTLGAINATLASTNGLRYKGGQDFDGADTLTVVADDLGNVGTGPSATTASISLTVDAVNDAPVAVNDFLTAAQGGATVLKVTDNDRDVDGDTLTIAATTSPTSGSLTLSVDGRSLTYTPNGGFWGADSFTYTVADPGGASATATASLAVADGQWAYGVRSVSSEWQGSPYEWRAVRALGVPDTFQSGDLETAWAPEPIDGGLHTLDVSLREAAPAQGFLIRQTSGNGFVTKVEFRDTSGTYHLAWAESSLDFDATPYGVVADFVRTLTASTTYSVDGIRVTVDTDRRAGEWEEIDAVRLLSPGWSSTLGVTAPSAAADGASVAEDGSVSVGVLGNDTHPHPAYLSAGTASHGYVEVDDNGTPTNLTDDYLVYTPEADYHGADGFTYTLTDIFGNASSASVTLSVTAVNDAPVASDVDAVAVAGTSASIAVLASVADIESNSLTLSLASGASYGTVTLSDNGTPTNYADDHFVYAPASGFTGVDGFTYSVSDGAGGTASASVLVRVYGAGQWANSVASFSSQYEPESGDDWAATQATGAADTFAYGDLGTAWAAAEADGGLQSLVLHFATPTAATGLLVRETNANGFVRGVALIDDAGGEHLLWLGLDPSQPGEATDLTFRFPTTGYNVAGVKLVVDTDHAPGEWEEIDAVRLLTGGTFSALSVTAFSAGGEAGSWTTTTGDAEGRPVEVVRYVGDAVWATTQYGYDASGFLDEQITTDFLSRQARTTYDYAGRVLSETAGYGSAQASTTSYGYDVLGQRVSLTDPNSNTTTWAYDGEGRVVSMTDPLSNTVTYSYDEEGRLSATTDREGRRREYRLQVYVC